MINFFKFIYCNIMLSELSINYVIFLNNEIVKL